MSNYYLNTNMQANGDYEVHKEGCRYEPHLGNRIYLGNFFSCQSAVAEARRYRSQVNGCYTCSRECHTQ